MFIALAWYFVGKFKFTFQADVQVQKEITRIHEGHLPEDVDDATKTLIETLSGQSYPKAR